RSFSWGAWTVSRHARAGLFESWLCRTIAILRLRRSEQLPSLHQPPWIASLEVKSHPHRDHDCRDRRPDEVTKRRRWRRMHVAIGNHANTNQPRSGNEHMPQDRELPSVALPVEPGHPEAK